MRIVVQAMVAGFCTNFQFCQSVSKSPEPKPPIVQANNNRLTSENEHGPWVKYRQDKGTTDKRSASITDTVEAEEYEYIFTVSRVLEAIDWCAAKIQKLKTKEWKKTKCWNDIVIMVQSFNSTLYPDANVERAAHQASIAREDPTLDGFKDALKCIEMPNDGKEDSDQAVRLICKVSVNHFDWMDRNIKVWKPEQFDLLAQFVEGEGEFLFVFPKVYRNLLLYFSEPLYQEIFLKRSQDILDFTRLVGNKNIEDKLRANQKSRSMKLRSAGEFFGGLPKD